MSVENTAFPTHKTKIVATIGPASESPEMLQRLIRAGLNVARLNFSHGEFSKHAEVVQAHPRGRARDGAARGDHGGFAGAEDAAREDRAGADPARAGRQVHADE